MTKAKALETAQGLLALPAEEVGKRALQASALADQLLEAAGPTASISLRSCEAR